MKKIQILFFLFLITTSCDVISKNRYFEVKQNAHRGNCGSHVPIGKAAFYIMGYYDGSYDFKGKTLIINENLIFKKKSKLSIFTDYGFSDKLFEKDFNLIFKNENYYIFSKEFDNFPDKKYFKNIIYFTINRLDTYIDMTTFYLYSEEAYKVYKQFDLKQFNEEKYRIGDSIAFEFNIALDENKIKEKESVAFHTGLAGCPIEETEKLKPKI